LATAAVHNHLIRKGLRTSVGLVLESGEPREIHHFCVLAGYGAEAINPYLAFETLGDMHSTYQSYCGAQIFDAVGLSSELIDKYFFGTSSMIEGVGLNEIAIETMNRHQSAFGNNQVLSNSLDIGGDYSYRMRGEAHSWNPNNIAKLQHAVRGDSASSYKEFADDVNRVKSLVVNLLIFHKLNQPLKLLNASQRVLCLLVQSLARRIER